MKLNADQLEIIRTVRRKLEYQNHPWYICLAIREEIELAAEEELAKWYNQLFFWRRYAIRDKWLDIHHGLTRAINWKLNGASTVGTWFENVTRKVGLNLPEHTRNNRGIYKQIRLAWLDRIIETGEIK
jgi:small-conductance mechanosensitive channel